jgi:hypothetical protein
MLEEVLNQHPGFALWQGDMELRNTAQRIRQVKHSVMPHLEWSLHR